jgi:hypothetical protein
MVLKRISFCLSRVVKKYFIKKGDYDVLEDQPGSGYSYDKGCDNELELVAANGMA